MLASGSTRRAAFPINGIEQEKLHEVLTVRSGNKNYSASHALGAAVWRPYFLEAAPGAVAWKASPQVGYPVRRCASSREDATTEMRWPWWAGWHALLLPWYEWHPGRNLYWKQG